MFFTPCARLPQESQPALHSHCKLPSSSTTPRIMAAHLAPGTGRTRDAIMQPRRATADRERAMSEVVRWSRDGEVTVVMVDNPPVNAISHDVRKGLYEAFSAADADPAVKAIVLACTGRTFMAGADITEFGKPWADPGLREVVLHIEATRKPVVAAIHGTALGGGFEIALGCHYRCAVASAQIGFPEVNLGLIPGAHGTQRLPRLVGIRAALDMVISGKPVQAPQARALGALDEIIEGELVPGAVAYARRLVASGSGPRRVRDLPVAGERVDARFFQEYRQSIAEKTRGY